jgi:hypothetical protein
MEGKMQTKPNACPNDKATRTAPARDKASIKATAAKVRASSAEAHEDRLAGCTKVAESVVITDEGKILDTAAPAKKAEHLSLTSRAKMGAAKKARRPVDQAEDGAAHDVAERDGRRVVEGRPWRTSPVRAARCRPRPASGSGLPLAVTYPTRKPLFLNPETPMAARTRKPSSWPCRGGGAHDAFTWGVLGSHGGGDGGRTRGRRLH